MKLILSLLTLSVAAIAQPAITAVQDAGAYTSNIAQGSVFVVKGAGLSAAGLVQATPPTYPTTLNSVRISLTAITGGAVVNPPIAYTYNVGGVNQLAAVLPSSTAIGAYDLRVENGAATSSPFRMSVVARKPGIVTVSSDGVGPAQATLDGKLILQRVNNLGKLGDFDSRSARPGERVDLWGTGLGPDLASDTGGTSGDQTTVGQIRVLVNGAEVIPAYAGRSQGYPGLDQIAFTLPSTVALNCAVTIQVRAGDVLSNAITIATSTSATGACPTNTIRINEIESNGGTPGDWVELYNPGTTSVSIAGYGFKDNDDTRTFKIPAGTVIAPGGYYLLEEAAFNFGLGTPDSARLYSATGELVDAFSWTPHATTTLGRCPNVSGALVTTASSTKGAANDCGLQVKINEVESNGGDPGDWVELYNAGVTPASVGGFVFKDNDDSRTYAIPAGTTIPVGGYYLLEEAAFGFGLGAADSARLYDTTGSVVDAYTWTAHAATTYGRCPNVVGQFSTTIASTKGAANNCAAATAGVTINEVESNGGTPGDWFELLNTGATAVNLSGWKMLDTDDTHTAYTFPTGTSLAPGAYLVVEESSFNFGLGAPDGVRIFDASGTPFETYTWPTHAPVTYGRCANGTGAFVATASSTKGAANDCGSLVKINEVESDGGAPGDWVELFNPGTTPANIAGFVFKDNDDTHAYTIPAGTTIPAGGYFTLEEATFGFGLGSADSARLFDVAGAVADSYSWTAHATTTYGRCPNGTGSFATTTASTKGAVNACTGDANFAAWLGSATIQTVDALNAFPSNLSGLDYEGSGSATPGVLWAARNGPGAIFRLVFNGTNWVPDTANDWGSGKLLRFLDGTGDPDAEGLTFAGTGSSAGLYVATERNNAANSVSRNAIVRFDPAAAGSTLTATHEWNLTADLPVTGANLGLEAITWIPDTFLVSKGFFDEVKNRLYNPADYANHGTGIFFVGLEANGLIYAYALDQAGTVFTRIATITSGFAGVMDLQFDSDLGDFWAICDDTCQGRSVVLRIDPATGKFIVARRFERPTGMPNLNNEGFAIAPASLCVGGNKPVFWSDDSNTDGHAIRSGSLSCSTF
ncbi:MAG: lamin tail domain-containing protein [Bryobacteraceae bacterium]